MFWFFDQEACGILAPWPGIKPTPPAMEGEVLTTGLAGKSLSFFFFKWGEIYFKTYYKLKKTNDINQRSQFSV